MTKSEYSCAQLHSASDRGEIFDALHNFTVVGCETNGNDGMTTSALRTWSSIGVLCIASFAMVTSEFAPIGLLSQISAELDQEPSTVALTVTLYAWVGAGGGLLSSWLSHRITRKFLLISLMLILAMANAMAALSSDFTTLLGSRALGAVGHGIFWAIAAATAAHLAPLQRIGLATSIVLGGISIASVMGVPVVNLIGQHNGWRSAFFCLALMCLTSAALIAAVLPRVTIRLSAKVEGLSSLFHHKDLRVIYTITALTAAAHFGAYAFIEPFIKDLPFITPYLTAVFLLVFGVAGLIGNLLSALLLDRFLKRFIFVALLAIGCALLILGTYGRLLGITSVSGLLVIWGIAISALFTGLQTWVLRIAGSLMVRAAAVHTAVLNSAIGLGVIVGGRAFEVVGVRGAMISAGLLIVPAMILMITSIICGRKKHVVVNKRLF